MPLKLTLYRRLPSGSTEERYEIFPMNAQVEELRPAYYPNGTIILYGKNKVASIGPDVVHWTLDVTTDKADPVEGEVKEGADFGVLKLDHQELKQLKRLLESYEHDFRHADKDEASTHNRIKRAVERLFDKVKRS